MQENNIIRSKKTFNLTFISSITNISMFWQRATEGRLKKFWEKQFAWGRISWFSKASGKNYWTCGRISTPVLFLQLDFYKSCFFTNHLNLFFLVYLLGWNKTCFLSCLDSKTRKPKKMCLLLSTIPMSFLNQKFFKKLFLL